MATATQAPAASGVSPSVYHLGMPSWYKVDIVLTPGQAGVIAPVFQIENDSDFDLWWLSASSILANAAAGLFAVKIFDKFVNKPFISGDGFLNGENWFGTGQNPFSLPAPWRWYRQQVIQCTFNERSNVGGQNNTVQLAFGGYKVDL